MPFIQFDEVSKIYPPYFKALDKVSLVIKRGEFVLITGPTGAGKTTLLKLLYREEIPSSGEVLFDGRPVSRLSSREIQKIRSRMGIIFQDLRLFPELSVYENIKISLILCNKKIKNMKYFIYEALERFNLAHKASKKVMDLSGGEQQKVAIIRAILREPELLVADEPTGNLDPESIREILKILKELNNKGCTILFATHDPVILKQAPGKLVILNRGRLVENVGIYSQDRT